MHVPRSYALTDRDVIRDVVTDHDFAVVISHLASGAQFVDHLPLHYDHASGTFFGHFAQANPHSSGVLAADNVTAVFSGAHAYVSPRWLSDTANVPTWNYVAVHVHGHAEPMPEWETIESLAEQVARQEAHVARPWTIGELGGDLMKSLTAALVGFRLVPCRIEAKAKLSQTRAPDDRARIIQALDDRGTDGARGVANLMRRRIT